MPEVTQGNGEMPEERLDKVREGIRAMEELGHDRDMLKRRLDDTLQRCAALQAELGALQVAQARDQTTLELYQRERDQAVAKRAEVEALFGAVFDIMQKHRKPTVIEETAPDDRQ